MTSESAVAARWFSVRAEYEHFGVLKFTLRSLRELLFAVLTLGVFLGTWDPKRFCDVLVIRNDTEEVVVAWSYCSLGQGDRHVNALRDRLRTVHVYDFCRSLGLRSDLVAGIGADPPTGDIVDWRAIKPRERRSRDH